MGISARRRLGVVGLALTGGVAVTVFGLGSGTTPQAAAAPALDPFDDCAELHDWYVDATIGKVGPWGLDGGFVAYDAMASVPANVREVAGNAAESAESAESVGNGATGTNIQEAGVDEPDIAKTNGRILVTVEDRSLVVFDVTGNEPVEIARLDLGRDMWGAELLLVGDRVLVLSGAGGYYGGPIMTDAIVPGGRVAPGYWGYAGRTTILTIDVSDPTDPTEVDEQTLEASLVSTRQYGDVVRIVTTSTPTFDFVYPTKRLSEQEAKQRNREIVRESAPEDWLPKDADGESIMTCMDVSRPADASAMSTISILTLDPADPGSRDSIGVAASGDLVYSSADRLYVATSDWGWGWGGRWPWQRVRTDVHAFALDGLQTTYTASGDVPGYVPDRWAFSEFEGELRVASTRADGSESLVTVLTEDGDELVTRGWVGGMGKQEDIKAVRWFGDIAVVVTFRTMDPLYTIDLSDPADPRVVGELKIPGFSEYLHPVGGDILLGVGQRANERGLTKGSQVQSFDLSDLTDPTQIESLRFDGDYSPVEQDSRAFTFLTEQRLALVPTGSWRGGNTVEVVRVGADGSLEAVASLDLAGWTEGTRAVPLGGDRVVLVARGIAQEIVDVSQL
ncbi:MAG: beta-propeller domain-containing protein [Nocardioidaceae bacterium]